MNYDLIFYLLVEDPRSERTATFVDRNTEVKMAKNNRTEMPRTPKLVPSNKTSTAGPVSARSEQAISRPPQPVLDPDSFERLHEMVRLRAYELYEKRGRGEGLGLEEQDWLQAEEEVMEQYRKRTA